MVAWPGEQLFSSLSCSADGFCLWYPLFSANTSSISSHKCIFSFTADISQVMWVCIPKSSFSSQSIENYDTVVDSSSPSEELSFCVDGSATCRQKWHYFLS